MKAHRSHAWTCLLCVVCLVILGLAARQQEQEADRTLDVCRTELAFCDSVNSMADSAAALDDSEPICRAPYQRITFDEQKVEMTR